jgi:hypothetical protein
LTDFEFLKSELQSGDFSCVVIKNGKKTTSTLPSIKPLLALLAEDENYLKNADVADKVVGKAAALLLAYGKAAAVFGATMSSSAAEVLKQHNIPYACTNMVDFIENRTKTGMCPMEQLCLEIDDPAAAYAMLKAKV